MAEILSSMQNYVEKTCSAIPDAARTRFIWNKPD